MSWPKWKNYLILGYSNTFNIFIIWWKYLIFISLHFEFNRGIKRWFENALSHALKLVVYFFRIMILVWFKFILVLAWGFIFNISFEICIWKWRFNFGLFCRAPIQKLGLISGDLCKRYMWSYLFFGNHYLDVITIRFLTFVILSELKDYLLVDSRNIND